MPLTAHAITARKAELISPTHRVSVLTYINTDSTFNKRKSTFREIHRKSGIHLPCSEDRACEWKVAGAVRLELTTCGFGDRRSTN